MDSHIQVKNLNVYYGKQQALKNINIEIPKKQITVIMGPSGCGKSTLLNVLGCLDRPSSGSYWLGDVDVSTMDRYQELGEAGLRMIDGMVNREAAMIAYVNDFHLMMWMSLAVIPLVFLIRKAQPLQPMDRPPMDDMH